MAITLSGRAVSAIGKARPGHGRPRIWTSLVGSACMHAHSLQSCPTLCDTVDCSSSGSSVRGNLQARILEWVAMPSFRGPSQPRGQTWVSCIAGRFFTIWATPGEPLGYVVRSHWFLSRAVMWETESVWGWAGQDEGHTPGVIWNWSRGERAIAGTHWTSLVVQWLKIRLSMQRTQVWSLVQEDTTCRGAAKPVRHNYWACFLQRLKPKRPRAVLLKKRSHRNEQPEFRNREEPRLPQLDESSCSHEDPAQSKVNEWITLKNELKEKRIGNPQCEGADHLMVWAQGDEDEPWSFSLGETET